MKTSQDEEPVTAGALRAMGTFVPFEIPDHVRCRVTKRLDADSETLHVVVEAFPDGYVDHVSTTVKIG